MTSPESPDNPTSVIDRTPATPPISRRRGLGVAALVLAIVPVVVALIFVVIAIAAGATDDTGWAILGWAILGVYVSVPAGLVFGGIAVGLGIAAAVKNRGRRLGIAGIVIGGLSVLSVILFLITVVTSAAL
jgi:hypothetical protein